MSETNNEFAAINQSMDATIAKRDDMEMYVQAALDNLRATSRTASGIIDTSASEGKAEKMTQGATAEQTADRALTNFEQTVRELYLEGLRKQRSYALFMPYLLTSKGVISLQIPADGLGRAKGIYLNLSFLCTFPVFLLIISR